MRVESGKVPLHIVSRETQPHQYQMAQPGCWNQTGNFGSASPSPVYGYHTTELTIPREAIRRSFLSSCPALPYGDRWSHSGASRRNIPIFAAIERLGAYLR